MTLSINYQYNRDDFLSLEEINDLCSRLMEGVLNTEHFPFDAEVSLLITSDCEIRILNNEFRGIDSPTDVLSFPSAEFDGQDSFKELSAIDELFNPETDEFMLGDIVISAPCCIRQAKTFGHSLEREFSFLFTHSLLHLLGYDHEEDDEKKLMEKKQEEILNLLGINR